MADADELARRQSDELVRRAREAFAEEDERIKAAIAAVKAIHAAGGVVEVPALPASALLTESEREDFVFAVVQPALKRLARRRAGAYIRHGRGNVLKNSATKTGVVWSTNEPGRGRPLNRMPLEAELEKLREEYLDALRKVGTRVGRKWTNLREEDRRRGGESRWGKQPTWAETVIPILEALRISGISLREWNAAVRREIELTGAKAPSAPTVGAIIKAFLGKRRN